MASLLGASVTKSYLTNLIYKNKMKFKLWLEFEELEPSNWNIEDEFCNIHVELLDGRQYGINVWTFKYLETSIKQDKENGENLNGLYQSPPDLFVKELTRNCIEKVVADLLKKGDLEDCLNPSVIDNEAK